MRYRTLLLSTIAVIGLSTAVPAAETSPEGADAIVRSLTGLLPEAVSKTGFITATPEGDHYALRIDIGKAVALFKPEKGTFSFDTVYDLKIYPAGGPDGLMRVSRDAAPLAVTGKWDIGTEKGDLSYLIKDFVLDGQFDPAISYFRSATGQASGGSLDSFDGKLRSKATFGPMDFTMTGQTNTAGSLDLSSNSTISAYSQSMTGPDAPEVNFTISKVAMDAKISGLKLKEIIDLAGYVQGHMDEKPMAPATRRGIADLLAKALPLFDGLAEEIRLDGLSVGNSGMGVKFASAAYRLGMTGVKDNGEVQFGLSASGPEITGIPQVMVYGGLIPKTMTMTLSINGLNLATMANGFIENAEKDLDDPIFAEIGKSVLKDGRMNIDVSEFAATSPLYNISVKGHMETKVDVEPPKATAVFDVTARDLDGTIKGIQELAQSVPDLNTASFGLMMAKGMAKNNPDGTSVWKVEVADDGKVKINGQALPQ